MTYQNQPIGKTGYEMKFTPYRIEEALRTSATTENVGETVSVGKSWLVSTTETKPKVGEESDEERKRKQDDS